MGYLKLFCILDKMYVPSTYHKVMTEYPCIHIQMQQYVFTYCSNAVFYQVIIYSYVKLSVWFEIHV